MTTEKFVMTLITLLLVLAVYVAPIAALLRGIHDKARWNVSWWKESNAHLTPKLTVQRD